MPERRPRVYVPNKAGHDYSDAERFGDLVFITEGVVNKFALQIFYRHAAEAMFDAEPQDYILIASLNSLCAICTAIMARRTSKVRFLLFRKDKYIERVVDVDALMTPPISKIIDKTTDIFFEREKKDANEDI